MNEEGIKHLDRLFALHDEAVADLSTTGGPTDVEELENTFKKFLVIAVAGLFDAEIDLAGQKFRLEGGKNRILLNFITAFVTAEEEAGDSTLTEALNTYLELREARNKFAHQYPGERNEKFDGWSVQDVKDKYKRALPFFPKFEEKVRMLAKKQREGIK